MTLSQQPTNTTGFNTNEIHPDSGNVYFCKENIAGQWYIKKASPDGVFSHATMKNNATITTYTAARNAVTTLTYGNYSDAFG